MNEIPTDRPTWYSGSRSVAARVMSGALRGQVTRTLSDVAALAESDAAARGEEEEAPTGLGSPMSKQSEEGTKRSVA